MQEKHTKVKIDIKIEQEVDDRTFKFQLQKCKCKPIWVSTKPRDYKPHGTELLSQTTEYGGGERWHLFGV